MPRRLVSSEIFFNDKVAELPTEGKLLFIGMITNADDEGRLKGSPKFLKARIFPYDNIEVDSIKTFRDKCHRLGLIQCYEVDGFEYIRLVGWDEHQSLRKDRKKVSTIPLPLVNQLSTNCQPNDNHDGNQLSTKCHHKISKDKVIEDNIIIDEKKISSLSENVIYEKIDDSGNPVKIKKTKDKKNVDPLRGEKAKEVFSRLDKLRGYRPTVKRGAENKAVLKMLNLYTPDQIIETWQVMKREPFWSNKELFMMSVESQIGAKINGKNKRGYQPEDYENPDEYFKRTSSAKPTT